MRGRRGKTAAITSQAAAMNRSTPAVAARPFNTVMWKGFELKHKHATDVQKLIL